MSNVDVIYGPRELKLAILERVDNINFERLVFPTLGLSITHPWRGVGSAIFLELGPLKRVPRIRVPGHDLKGLATVMIEWGWRVERPRSIEVGSWSTDRKIDVGIRRLKRLKVESIKVEGRLPELTIGLSDGRWLRTFMISDSQPSWVLFLPDGSWLHVERGMVIREDGA